MAIAAAEAAARAAPPMTIEAKAEPLDEAVSRITPENRHDVITIPRQRHFHRRQPQHPDGEGGNQLPVQLEQVLIAEA
jgi:hypothetical protein